MSVYILKNVKSKSKIRLTMKSKIACLLLLFATTVSGQIVKIKSHYSLSSKIKEASYYPILSPKGNQLLFTTENHKGLNLYNFVTGEVKVISTDNGAGFAPSFSGDEKKIYYNQLSITDGRKYKSLMCFDSSTRRVAQLSSPQRTMKEVRNIQKRVMTKVSSPLVSVSNENLKVVLYRNGIRTELEPVGKVAGYIWVSLSPNGKMILFTAASKGTFVCDLSGKVIVSLGKLNAPVWYNDDFVVGMDDKNDENFIISSKIVLVTIDGKNRQELTSSGRIALYPVASSEARKIAYCTSKGELYVMEIENNQPK